ncbi:MAG: hypothetical protein PVH88_08010 [Ignavibacteria bacterium]|jgi:hypothetical protein
MKKIALPLIIASILLHGCINFQQTTKLYKDGSGESFIHFWTEIIKDSTDNFKLNFFNEDSLISKFTSPFCNLTDSEVYRNFRDSTIHAKIWFNFDDIEKLGNIKGLEGNIFEYKTISEKEKIFTHKINIPYFFTSDTAASINMSYTYYLPGNILEHNADRVSTNELTWFFNQDDLINDLTIRARIEPFKLKETPVWIYYIALFVILILILFFFVKKNNSIF